MNTYVCVVLLAAVVVAEPPQYRQAKYESARQENAQQDSQQTEDAPYPAAGFRPTKAFNLPNREDPSPPSILYGVSANSYGAPLNTYTVPQREYGPPDAEAKNKDEGDVESIDPGEKKDDKKEKLEEEPKNDVEVVSAQGAYYVLFPGSQLQKIQFQTENDLRSMAYTARLQYRNEDRAPIYVYTAVPQYQSAAYVQLF